MARWRLTLVLGMALWGCVGARSPAAGRVAMTSQDEAALLQLEQDVFTALRTKDPRRLAPLLADGFELHLPGAQPLGKAAFLEGMASVPQTILSIDSDDL